MPWHTVHNHSECPASKPWAVVKDADGSVAGCHVSEDDANAQIAALYASEPKAASEEDPVVLGIYEFVASGGPAMPMAATGGPPEKAPITAYSDGRWRGILAVEGVETGDGREFAPDALTWRDLPLTIMWCMETGPGHDGSVIVGSIDAITRDGNTIRGEGRFDMNGEFGAEAHRLAYEGFLRGMSVTLDDVSDADVELVWPDEAASPDGAEDPMMELFMEPEKVIFHHARIMDTLLTSQPALQEATFELVPNDEEAVITMPSSVTASAPLAPPSLWFEHPHLPGVTPLTVTDEGQVYGHLAVWGTCHTSFAGTCITPPHEDEFSYFTTGELVTREGDHIPVGQLTLGAHHAPANLSSRPAAAHYEHTGHACADVTAGADAHGIWVAGAIRPQVTDREIRVLRASALSGDWRRIAGKMRLVAALVVNVPGFPIPRTRTYTRDGEQQALVASGVLEVRRPVNLSGRITERIAASIGRDRKSRLQEMRGRVHPSIGNLKE